MNALIRFESLLIKKEYRQLINRFDHESHTLWSFMNPSGRICFNSALLGDIADFGETLRLNQGKYLTDGALATVDFAVLASCIPGIFNFGGDLDMFRKKIKAGDIHTLRDYAYQCIDNIWNRLNHYGAPLTTISLIQGQTLGGGFEAALTADVIIAEEGSILGLPEILFNLFPGMGALSLLTRKVGLRQAEEIVLSGKMYSAEELHGRGVIDLIVGQGTGADAVNKWIAGNRRQKNGYRAVQRSKQRIMPIDYSELIDIADIWVDSAMQVDKRGLRMMGRLVEAQNKMETQAPLP